jgi:hypothetical protein
MKVKDWMSGDEYGALLKQSVRHTVAEDCSGDWSRLPISTCDFQSTRALVHLQLSGTSRVRLGSKVIGG